MSIKLCFIIRMRMVQQTITIGCVSVQVRPKEVGPHKDNRGTTGLCVRHCHKLLLNVTDSGFSHDATNPYAIEDDDEMSNAKFALDLTKNIPGLAPLHAIRYASLSCGHTNHSLCCALDEVECDIPELSEDGHMSKAKIVGRCPTIEAPLRDGLTWKMFKAKVADLYPNFMKLAQAALNTVGNVQQAMGEFAVLKEVAVRAAEQMKSNPPNVPVNWKTIQQQIVAQKTSVEPEGRL